MANALPLTTLTHTSSATTSLRLLALEIALLCYPYNSPKLSHHSKTRLRTIMQAREAQALGLDPDLFVRLLASCKAEYQAHWEVWRPVVRHPSRHFNKKDLGDDEGDDKEKKRESLVRFANEVVVGEWCVADAGLDTSAIRVLVQTVETCRALGRGVNAAAWDVVLESVRRAWVEHWVEWASVDEEGRTEYGVLLESGGREEATYTKSRLVRLRLVPDVLVRFPHGPSSNKLSSSIMVGRMVLTRRTEDGEEEMVEGHALAERVAGEYERVRAEIRAGRR
ncbi:hypothetical protein DPSP01_000011 [Paraphaeosphaeria sporulosa]|uniref:Uncharacterized protein n=1 Tax=Paraphaeosphaeria sporulosa TaxID=1460663 RepID=A0A177D0X4_9PLEO|nr:uncharacterized protein CC84DRAFT_1255196 [Paraphaeosphaeria sporulosa]OAG13068.1 hypothetical protein CC84DRAFT_1255196 [Paraphaeosphaeria sporulosa]